MRFLRSNTAVIVTVGPFYDKTDGVTIENALTATNERITLTADTDAGSAPTLILDNITGAAAATSNDIVVITGGDAGFYQMELAAADTNRVGRMFLSITDAANHVPVFHEFFVLPQAIYDWLTGVIVPLPANVTTWLGTAAATPTVAGVPEVDLTHVAGATTNVSTLATSVQTIVGVTAAVIADAVLDEDMTAHQTQGSLGQAIGDPAADTNTIFKAVVTDAAGANVAADIVAVKAETASILTDTAEIGAAGAGLTNIGTIATVTTLTNKTGFSLAATGLDAIGAAATGVQAIVDAVWDEDVDTGHQTAGTAGKKLDDAGAAADPWATAVPGAYGAGTAGSRLGKLPDVTAGAAGGVFIAGANAATSITTALTANVIGNVTGNLSGSVGSVTGAVGSVTGAVGSVTGAVGSVTGAVGSVTGAVGSVAGNVDGNVTGTVAGVTPSTAAQVAAVLTTAITESYRANGAAPTLAQFMSEVIAHLGESAISGTTKTISKLDHVTAAETFTLDDASTPSSITRAT
jgi:hypothetical protein